MSMTDPIADLLTRIRNAQSAGKPTVGVGASKLKLAILKVLKDEGYIAGFGVDTAGAKSTLSIELKYHDGRPVIDRIERISRSGPAHLSRQGRIAQSAGRPGRGGRFHAAGHHVRRAGARGRHRRRSALRRAISVGFLPCLESEKSR